MVRIAVFPVPTPRTVRPGANRLIVAIPFAVTGASRNPPISKPVISLIFCVCCAASAITAQRLERSSGLSVIQAKS